MALILQAGPAVEPVGTVEAKAHCRVDVDDDDALLDALVVAARQYVEQVTRRSLVTQTWDLFLDGWPAGDTLVVPVPPLQSVTAVTYTDDAGTTRTVSSADYVVDTANEPGRVRLTSSASWPSETLQVVNGVQVRFVAGFGDAGADVPQPIRQAILLLVGHWYENREAVAVHSFATFPKEIPLAVDALLWPYRVLRWV